MHPNFTIQRITNYREPKAAVINGSEDVVRCMDIAEDTITKNLC